MLPKNEMQAEPVITGTNRAALIDTEAEDDAWLEAAQKLLGFAPAAVKEVGSGPALAAAMRRRLGISLKHMTGRHNQRRHGWRYGDLSKARRSMRGGDEADREQYRATASKRGIPMPSLSELKKVSKKPEPAPAPKPKVVRHVYKKYDPDDADASHKDFHKESGWKAWMKGLTSSEKWAIKEYVGRPGVHGTYQELNPLLRSGKFDPGAYASSKLTGVYKGLKAAIEKGRLHRDMILNRGMEFSKMYYGVRDGRYKKGDVITDPAFVSTAPKQGTATSWFFLRGSYPVLWRVKAQKGQKAAYVSWKELDNPYMHETEAILPPGTKFRIDKMGYESVKGQTVAVYDMTIVE